MDVKRIRKLIALAVFLSWAGTNTYAQFAEELSFVIRSNPISRQTNDNPDSLNLKETSEAKLFCFGLIKFYKHFISSQDIQVCNFTPSCSQFSLQAIQKYGIFRGILMTSDRLQRCSGFDRRHYPIDKSTGKGIDPVDNYSISSWHK